MQGSPDGEPKRPRKARKRGEDEGAQAAAPAPCAKTKHASGVPGGATKRASTSPRPGTASANCWGEAAMIVKKSAREHRA